ncbi:hypothetical protein vseg_001310 [Gypsophila vaccaria]
MTKELKNRVDSNGDTSLHRAIVLNARRLVKALVETKIVNLDMENKKAKTALDLIEEGCRTKSVDVFWYELYKKFLTNPDRLQKMKNQLGSSGGTPLHLAIEWDDLIPAKKLVWSQVIKLNIEYKNGKTALDLIEARCSQPDSFWYNFFEELLASKLVTYEMKNRVDVNGDTPLHKAIAQNAKKLVKTLINIKEVEYEVKNKNGKTAVDMIEEQCKDKNIDGFWFEQYKKFLENSDVLQKRKNRRASSGFTPLHIAIEWEDIKLAKTLVHTKGIELGIENPNRRTALELIEERSERTSSPLYELYKELWDIPNFIHELKNRQVQSTKETPLHRAIRWDDINLAKTLLETKGLELDIKDGNGRTALDLLDKRYKSREDKYRKWGEMCREIRLDPRLKVFRYKYLLCRTSFTDMRATLSVVAALLATIVRDSDTCNRSSVSCVLNLQHPSDLQFHRGFVHGDWGNVLGGPPESYTVNRSLYVPA